MGRNRTDPEMKTFAIVTPTIGRQNLTETLNSVQWQTWRSFVHVVIGDGPQSEQTTNEIRDIERREPTCIRYAELPQKMGCFGSPCRNMALEMIESENLAEYVVFLDDDNIMLPGSLQRFVEAIYRYNSPEVLYQKTIYRNEKLQISWTDFPLKNIYWDDDGGVYYATSEAIDITQKPLRKEKVTHCPIRGGWDGHCGCYRKDVIAGLRWTLHAASDWDFVEAITKRIKHPFIPVDGYAAVHF